MSKRNSRFCVVCGKPIENWRQFCSRQCSGAHRKASRGAERFWEKVNKVDGGCWEWTGSKRNGREYGQFWFNGKMIKASRHAYSLAYGPIPPGMNVLHRCDNPPCCNPAHLFLGTHQDNMQDALAKGRLTVGSRSPAAKLTESEVSEIRQRYQPRIVTLEMLSKEYGVAERIIWRILKRQGWKHVT